MSKRYLFFVEETYSFAILRPLQEEAWRQGSEVAWFLLGVDEKKLLPNEQQLKTVKDAISFNPVAVIVPGTGVPKQFPGLKVQVFHGFGIEKKGHFRMRGFFDLYCTHGPLTTQPFLDLAKKHKHFSVIETGWPKMDPMASSYDERETIDTPTNVLYAPTFSPSLSSAVDLCQHFEKLSKDQDYRITVKFHPKMKQEWITLYKKIENKNLQIKENIDFLESVKEADIVVSDTSSAVAEALCVGKPVLTYKTRCPANHITNFENANQLIIHLKDISDNYLTYKRKGIEYAKHMHPYFDGNSSKRVLEAIDTARLHRHTLKQKPLNLIRYFKMNNKLRAYDKL